jgi:hypothetical protein
MSLADLPHDVMLIILAELALEDHFWLSMTCRHFHFVIHSDEICRITLRVGFDYSKQQRNAIDTDPGPEGGSVLG